MNVANLRKRYLDFFAARDHRLLPSAPLVPNDPTLLFTSAGMVQFKDIYWGHTAAPHPRVVTCQKCFRTVDIENVGKTAFHHTFFEMLGNFSFGDYFKQGAIELAWEFLTQELGVPGERLTAAVYEEDDEAYEIWRDNVGLPTARIVRLGKEHNWWGPVGNSGPCGPDSEIHFDNGPEHGCGPDCLGAACDCDRFSEIWNLVFMEYDASEDGSLTPLDRKNIDTGMGLERTAAVLQGAKTNFETDGFRPITEAIEAACSGALTGEAIEHRNTIADHMRGILFLLADGVMPGNERQGYVLRRILRRAIRAGEKLELAPGSLATFIEPVIKTLGGVYPELVGIRDLGRRLITREEETFRRTLRDGERRLSKLLDQLGDAGDAVLPGELAFELTDTYGFPLEMTQEIAAERGVTIDLGGFETALDAQRTRSRTEIKMAVSADAELVPAGKAPTVFAGYDGTACESIVENVLPNSAQPSRLVFPTSPFYAESGGQVADTGQIENLDRPGTARVTSVTRNAKAVLLHDIEEVNGSFEVGDRCRLTVDVDRRRRIERNHTATHLLHAALRHVLGDHVKQAGSLVNDQELRFDFSHFEKLSPGQVADVERFATAAALADHPVTSDEVPLERAQELGAIGLFEDEYRGKATVRVVAVDDVSKELCGGTHVSRSGEIGLIKIVSEESIASGVRRIRALTGDGVLRHLQEHDALLARLHAELGDDPAAGVGRLKDEIKRLNQQLAAASASQAADQVGDLLAAAETVGEVKLISGRTSLDADGLKTLADLLEEQAGTSAVVLIGESKGRAIAVCKVSDGLDLDAGAIVRAMSKRLGGGGGGSRSFAQGGGPNAAAIDDALSEGAAIAREGLD